MRFIKIPIIILISLYSFSAFAEAYKIIVKSSKIEFHDFWEQCSTIGRISAENSKDYIATSSGIVDFISLKQGQFVNKGDRLIAIEQKVAESTKLAAETAVKSAQSDYDRDLLLLTKKFISQEALDKNEVVLNQAKQELAKAMSFYENMVIEAPFDGYVGVVRANVGERVNVGDYLFSVVSIDSNKLVFGELPEMMLGKIDSKSAVLVQDQDGKKVDGKITAVSDYISDKGTVTVKLQFPASAKIAYNSYVEPTIIYNQHRALALPEKAVLRNREGSFVYQIMDKGLIKQVYVTLGIRTDGMIEILSKELKEGDEIVLEGLTKVSDGVFVELTE